MKKCLGWINLLVVSRGKCNNGIKRENSTGSLSITGHTLYSRAKTRRYALQWNDKNLNLNFVKVCRIKSLKVYLIFLSF